MRYVVTAVRDRRAECFGQPIFTAHVQQGLRGFSDQINHADPQNVLFGHADDFDMYELGSFDDGTGKFECFPEPRLVALGKDLKRA